jgi:hypothetical protein
MAVGLQHGFAITNRPLTVKTPQFKSAQAFTLLVDNIVHYGFLLGPLPISMILSTAIAVASIMY